MVSVRGGANHKWIKSSNPRNTHTHTHNAMINWKYMDKTPSICTILYRSLQTLHVMIYSKEYTVIYHTRNDKLHTIVYILYTLFARTIIVTEIQSSNIIRIVFLHTVRFNKCGNAYDVLLDPERHFWKLTV